MKPEIEWVKYLFNKLDFLGFWEHIELNPNITFENKKYFHRRWDYTNLSQNPNITMDYILKNQDKPWAWGCISRNPNITMADIAIPILLPKNIPINGI